MRRGEVEEVIMLESLTEASFAPHQGTTFRLYPVADTLVEMRLIEVTGLPGRALPAGIAPLRDPFSLIFRGPLDPSLPQRIYPMEHEQMGTLELFLVPIGPDAEGMRYQAIFN